MKPGEFRRRTDALAELMSEIRTGASPDEVLAIVEHVFRGVKWRPIPEPPETASDALGAGVIRIVARLEVTK